MHRTGHVRRRPLSAGTLNPLDRTRSPGDGPSSPANELWVSELRQERPRTAPMRRRRVSSRPGSAASSRPGSAASSAGASPALVAAEEARHALAALEVDRDLEAAARAAEVSRSLEAAAAESQAKADALSRPSPQKLAAANAAARAAVDAAIAEQLEEEEAALEREAQQLAEHLANESFCGALLEDLVDVAAEQAEQALERAALERAASALTDAMHHEAVEAMIRAVAADALRSIAEEAEAGAVREVRSAAATKIAIAYRQHAARAAGRRALGDAEYAAREAERLGEFEEALTYIATQGAPFVDNELQATADEGRRIREEAKAGHSGESRAGAVLLDAPLRRKTASEGRVVSPSAYRLRKRKQEQQQAVPKPPVKKPEVEPPVEMQLEFEAHRQAGPARWEQSDAVAQGKIPPRVLEQMRARSSATLDLSAASLPPGTGKELGQPQSLLCGDASVIAAFVERDRTALTSIDLSGNFAVGVAGVARLAQALPNSGVASLNLSGCAVCGMCAADVENQRNFHLFRIDAIEELADALPETSLTSLDLSGSVIARPPLLGRPPDLRGVGALASALRRDDCPLVSLRLNGNALGDEGLALVSEALQVQHGRGALTALDLSDTQMLSLASTSMLEGSTRVVEGRGLQELSLMLSLRGGECPLSQLSLAGNELGLHVRPSPEAPTVRAASALAEALIASELRAVDLRRTRLSLEDESVLALALLEATTIGSLRVTPSWGRRRPAQLTLEDQGQAERGADVPPEEELPTLSEEDEAVASAAMAAGYLDEVRDRRLEGDCGSTPRGTRLSTVALRYTEQLAIEHGARLRLRHASERDEDEENEEEEEAAAQAGSAQHGTTALHWVVGRAPSAPNGVAWVRWLLARRPEAAGQRDVNGRTALDLARLCDNPHYIGLLQNAVEAACTFRERYILTTAGLLDIDNGSEPRAVRYEGVDRSTGQRVSLRFYAGASAGGAAAEAAVLRRVASVRYQGRDSAVAVRVPGARSIASEGATLLVQNLVATFNAAPTRAGQPVNVVVVETGRPLRQLFDERHAFTPIVPPRGLATTDPDIARLGLDVGVAANAAVVSTLAISFMPPEAVRSLARQLVFSLHWLHDSCRTSHCDIHPGTVAQFDDGGWRLTNLTHAQHFSAPLQPPVRARTCAPELARQIVAELDSHKQLPEPEHEAEPAVQPPPSRGTVTVEVVSCAGLLPAEHGGACHPYVRLHVGGETFQTEPRQKTQSPKYTQAFDFPVGLLANAAAEGAVAMRAEVYDWVDGTSDDFLGEANVDITGLLGAHTHGWEDGLVLSPPPLRLGDPRHRLSDAAKRHAGDARSANPCGTITVQLSYALGGEEPVADSKAKRGAESEPAATTPLLSVYSYDMWGLGVLLLEAATARGWEAVGGEDHHAPLPQVTTPTEAQLRRIAALTDEEIHHRVREVADSELCDLLLMLLSLDPRERPTAEQLLGKGGGQLRPHRFLCKRGDEAHGWLEQDRRQARLRHKQHEALRQISDEAAYGEAAQKAKAERLAAARRQIGRRSVAR